MKLFWLMEPTETGVGGGLSCCPRDLRVGGGGASASGFAFPWLQGAELGQPPALEVPLAGTVGTAPSSWPAVGLSGTNRAGCSLPRRRGPRVQRRPPGGVGGAGAARLRSAEPVPWRVMNELHQGVYMVCCCLPSGNPPRRKGVKAACGAGGR